MKRDKPRHLIEPTLEDDLRVLDVSVDLDGKFRKRGMDYWDHGSWYPSAGGFPFCVWRKTVVRD
jgi:hypothetical protein